MFSRRSKRREITESHCENFPARHRVKSNAMNGQINETPQKKRLDFSRMLRKVPLISRCSSLGNKETGIRSGIQLREELNYLPPSGVFELERRQTNASSKRPLAYLAASSPATSSLEQRHELHRARTEASTHSN